MTTPIYTLQVQQHFAAAMQLTDFSGPCAQLHGHTYQVTAMVSAHKLDQHGMLVDHTALSSALQDVLAPFDHAFLNELPAFTDKAPTSEHLAQIIYQTLAKRINTDRITLQSITIAENPHVLISYAE